MKDTRYRYLFANRALCELYGTTAEALAGCEDGDFFDAATARKTRENDRRVIEGGERVESVDMGFTVQGGEPRSYLTTLLPLRGPGGEIYALCGIATDITERKRAEQALRDSESFANGTLDAVSANICVLDRAGVILAVNQAWRDFHEQNAGEGLPLRGSHYVGTNYLAICEAADESCADEALRMAAGIRGVADGQLDSFTLEYPCHGPDRQRWFIARVTRFRDDSGNLVIAHEDITLRKQAEARSQLAASVFTHAREGIAITDADANIIDVNSAFTHITGYPREEVLSQNPRLLKSDRQSAAFYAEMWRDLLEQGYWRGEVWNRRKSGEVYAEMLTISAVRDAAGAVQNYVSLFSDITPIKEYQQRLERLAHYDTLTNLPNRMLLADRLRQAMAQAQRRGVSLAVAYLDLDGFKAVNDRHGHDVGDELLIIVSHRMKAALREGDTLARIGGDEFVAVLVDLDGAGGHEAAVQRLLDVAAEPVMVRQQLLNVSASIGVTVYPQDDGDADQLMRHADQAMYLAKQAGKNRSQVFDVAQEMAARHQKEILRRIRLALDQGEFLLHYQPQVNLRTGEVVGAEALIRWQCPERGLLLPADFLPVIGNHPLGVELGEWVIGTALAQLAQWRAAGLDIPVGVNIGSSQLQYSSFAARLRTLLAACPDAPANRLDLEILEASALEDIGQAIQVMRACRELGVRFTLDDFGTGCSSLAYLKCLPIDTLKIDRSFVHDMLEDPEDLAIVEGVAGLAAAFRRRVIAEGVESLEHGAKLLSLGCELAQGNGIALPMAAAELPGWVAAWREGEAWTVCPGGG